MKISKRQLKRIIKEEKAKLLRETSSRPMDPGIYEEANDLAYQLVEDMLNSHGQTAEALNAIADALRQGTNEIIVDELLAERAMTPLRKMLNFAENYQLKVKGKA